MTLSIQLYSARNFPTIGDRLQEVAALGYSDVEPFRGLYDDTVGLASAIRGAGLTSRSGHYSLQLLETDRDGALRTAETLGNEIIVLPFLAREERPADGEGWDRVAERIGAVARSVTAQGFRVAWHNHDFELQALPDGRVPLEIILAAEPSLEWEADLAWVVRGGADPLDWLSRYQGRVAALHVKDIAPSGEKADEDGWADVGAGTLDWAALWTAGEAAGAELFVAEHDNPSDFTRFATRSLAAMRGFPGRG